MNSSIRIVNTEDYSKLISKVNTAIIMPQDKITIDNPTTEITTEGNLD